MPRVEYTRTDLVLTFRPRGNEIEVEAAFGASRQTLTIEGPGAAVSQDTLQRTLGGVIEPWVAAARQAEGDTHIPRVLLRVEGRGLAGEPWERMVPGLVDGFRPPAYALLRDTPVPARAATHPWTLPLRIVHEDPDGNGLVRDAVNRTFGGFVGPQAETAVRVLELPGMEMLKWAPDEAWPSAEVLHVSSLPLMLPLDRLGSVGLEAGGRIWLQRLTDQAQVRLLIVEAGSLGEESDARELATRLAARGGPAVLVLGEPQPEVIVGLYDFLIHDRPLDWIARELQGRGGWCEPPVAGVTLVIGAGREEAVRVSGPGMRLIELADLLEAGDRSAEADLFQVVADAKRPAPVRDETAVGGATVGFHEVMKDVGELRGTLGRMRSDWQYLAFEQHESGGLMPYAAELAKMRARVLGSAEPRVREHGSGSVSAGISRDPGTAPTRSRTGRETGTVKWFNPKKGYGYIIREGDEDDVFVHRSVVQGGGYRSLNQGDRVEFDIVQGQKGPVAEKVEAVPPQAVPSTRWVVPSLADAGGGGDIAQPGARLTLGQTYHLGIRIGERDERTRVVGAVGLLDEVLKLRPEDQGAWIEVGVTGIGFDVLGEPVQELWMPRGAGSEPITFAVVPRDDTVAVLRYTLYHRGSAVQSYRLAAATVPTPASPPGDPREALAKALEMTPDDVGGDGWLARMEFSLVADPAAMETRPPRAVSIIANDMAGKPVITVKGGDDFDVWFPGNVAPQVQRVRALLDQVASTRQGDTATYNFGRDEAASPPAVAGDPSAGSPAASPPAAGAAASSPAADPGAGSLADEHLNEGDEATLKAALKTLAEAGWDLYTQLISGPQRQILSGVLDGGDGQTIQVAHVLLEKVLPWSLLYDRPFTPNAQVDAQGNPLKVDVCLAALPGPDGKPSPVKCGQHPCILAGGDPALTPETVACPRHFWGFRHVVEVPPQQVPPGQPPAPQVDEVKSAKPASLVSGFNAHLPRAQAHSTRLDGLMAKLAGRAQWAVKEFAGQMIVHRLNAPDVDLVYLYCHARGGAADPTVSPCLEFVGLGDLPNRVAPGDLAAGAPWAHHPLVILNGCGTVGFSPDALSPFLPILVRDRGAAGVLGTEISVWEQLAGEFAEHFLSAFLAGRTAGQALLEARRKLLAQRNPLGLAYTLYASADLHFAP